MTIAERAIEEPKRTAADDSWDVWSNYYFCPTLCRSCEYFYKQDSNWPYHCKGPSSVAASHKSKKEGYKQYDDCRCYEEKKEETHYSPSIKQASTTAIDNIVEERRREREKEEDEWERRQEEKRRQKEEEERRREEEIEYEQTHCFSCGEKGFLVEFHGKYFHEKCLQEFKQTEKGKEWIAVQEKDEKQKTLFLERCKQIRSITEKYGNFFNDPIEEFKIFCRAHAAKDYENMADAFIDADLELFTSYIESLYNKRKAESEKARQEQEEQERLKKEAEDQAKQEQAKKARIDKEKKSLQRKVKLPVFIFGLIPIFWAFGTFPTIGTWLPIVSLIVIIFIYYKMLTGWINSSYDVIEQYRQKGKNPSKGYKFIVYFGVVVISTVIYIGLLILIMHILLKVW